MNEQEQEQAQLTDQELLSAFFDGPFGGAKYRATFDPAAGTLTVRVITPTEFKEVADEDLEYDEEPTSAEEAATHGLLWMLSHVANAYRKLYPISEELLSISLREDSL